MSIKKITKTDFGEFITNIINAGQNVFGVQAKTEAKGDRFAFGPLASADDLRLDYDVTLSPPKKYLLPAKETLVKFEVGGAYESSICKCQNILIGVHPYDLVAIKQMDELFSQDEYDTHYMTRRSNTTIIACDVAKASPNVFASSMGTATVKDGYDILLTDIGDAFVVDAATEKGQALLAQTAMSATDASEEDLAARKAVQDKNDVGLNQHELKCAPGDIPKLLEDGYENPVWQEKAATCYSCGSCNLTCPTCYCFDVQDDVAWSLKEGSRHRAWDGCLLENFANVAGDHNFRKKREARYRHRLYRKGSYVPKKIGGEIACVGCGRCVGACVPDIANPVTVYNRLLEDTK